MPLETLQRKSLDTGIPVAALEEVWKRGYAAGSIGTRGKGEKGYAYAMGRVNAFLRKQPNIWKGADNDVREKYGLH